MTKLGSKTLYAFNSEEIVKNFWDPVVFHGPMLGPNRPEGRGEGLQGKNVQNLKGLC